MKFNEERAAQCEVESTVHISVVMLLYCLSLVTFNFCAFDFLDLLFKITFPVLSAVSQPRLLRDRYCNHCDFISTDLKNVEMF